MRTVRSLRETVPQVGRVERILLRPARRAPPEDVTTTTASAGVGLVGDRARAGTWRASPRQVTLVQAEHLAVVAALLGRGGEVDAALLRRNLVVAGIPLLALTGMRFRVGGAVLEGTGRCRPCSRMEEALGPGGYQAVRGHGGITAAVVGGGGIGVGSSVAASGPVDRDGEGS